MGAWRSRVAILVLAASCTMSGAAIQQSSAGQQPPSAEQPAPKPSPAPEKKPVMETASMRLVSARNILIVRTRGSMVPFEVIQSTLDGWGRFTLVETRDKADL